MQKYIEILRHNSLFYGIKEEKIQTILQCTDCRYAEYGKDEMVISEGEVVHDIGIVLSGHGRSIKQELSGKTSIVTLLEPGSFIGIILAGSRECKSPVYVQALENLAVLFIPVKKLICRCIKDCPEHDTLLYNYIASIAEKALLLHDRNDCLIKSTVREKVLTYLRRMAREAENNTFTIPLDRSGMAEYINVERSALSRELSRMKKEGVIDFYKNSFKIY
jgi:CRP-like cAMP-binding protein